MMLEQKVQDMKYRKISNVQHQVLNCLGSALNIVQHLNMFSAKSAILGDYTGRKNVECVEWPLAAFLSLRHVAGFISTSSLRQCGRPFLIEMGRPFLIEMGR
jgi:hypothetical protein